MGKYDLTNLTGERRSSLIAALVFDSGLYSMKYERIVLAFAQVFITWKVKTSQLVVNYGEMWLIRFAVAVMWYELSTGDTSLITSVKTLYMVLVQSYRADWWRYSTPSNMYLQFYHSPTVLYSSVYAVWLLQYKCLYFVQKCY